MKIHRHSGYQVPGVRVFRLILRLTQQSLASGQRQESIISRFSRSAKFMLTEEHFKCKDQPQTLIQDADVMTRKASNMVIFGGVFTFMFFWKYTVSSPASLICSRMGTVSHNAAHLPPFQVHTTQG